jgi:hypothetical protein
MKIISTSICHIYGDGIETNLFHVRECDRIPAAQTEISLFRQRTQIIGAVAEGSGNAFFFVVLLGGISLPGDVAVAGLDEVVCVVGHVGYFRLETVVWGNDLTVTGDDSMLALTEAGAGLSVAFITRY